VQRPLKIQNSDADFVALAKSIGASPKAVKDAAFRTIKYGSKEPVYGDKGKVLFSRVSESDTTGSQGVVADIESTRVDGSHYQTKLRLTK
jgi:hypothetical protein